MIIVQRLRIEDSLSGLGNAPRLRSDIPNCIVSHPQFPGDTLFVIVSLTPRPPFLYHFALLGVIDNKSSILRTLGSGFYGFGLLNLSFDWNSIGSVVSPTC